MVLFQIRLGSVATAGLNIPNIQSEYICHYKGGLIGKHFKMLTQVMSFLVFDLVPRDVLQAWLVIGRLMVLAWHTDIEDIDAYTVQEFLSLKTLVVMILAPQNKLSMCIQDFLHVTCKCSPSILISKLKFHFLVHLLMYIQHFGPAVLFSTERYESFNAVFRFSSIYSNHLTPSRDIARSFISMDSVKHIVTGGFWSDEQTGQWLGVDAKVLNPILNHPYHAALVGLPTEKSKCPGMFNF